MTPHSSDPNTGESDDPSSPSWPNPPMLPSMSDVTTGMQSPNSKNNLAAPQLQSDLSWQTGSNNQPRLSDVSASPPAPSPKDLPLSQPPATAPTLPPTPQHSVDHSHAMPSHMLPPPHQQHQPPSSTAATNPKTQYPYHSAPRHPISATQLRRANLPSERPILPDHFASRFQQQLNSTSSIPSRLTRTEPPVFSSKQALDFQLPPSHRPSPDARQPAATPLHPHPSDALNNAANARPPSRPGTPSEQDPPSFQNSDMDSRSSRYPSDLMKHAEGGPDATSLTQSRMSEGLLTSVEPASINAAASTHIDLNGLQYDFDNVKTRLGVGTYGPVYLGLYFGATVAIKRIHIPSVSPGLSSDPHVTARRADAIRQFARAIRRYERVLHPGIVRFLGVALPPDSSALLVTEFMEGGSLGDAMDRLNREGKSLQLESVVRIALRVCGGIRALHGLGCTWGDAKPGNILLSDALDDNGVFSEHAEARIADFGISKSVGQTLLGESTLAGTGTPPGTCKYMAPETFIVPENESLERAMASDIYSFGMVLYEMLTLCTPWKGLPMTEILLRVRGSDRPAWPSQSEMGERPPIPQKLVDIVEMCWHQVPEQRPSAEGVFASLEDFNMKMTESTTRRPVTDLSNGSAADVSADIQRRVQMGNVYEKQSTMSTAIALDDSVDLPNAGLNSTAESRRTFDVPEDLDDEGSDGPDSATARVFNPPAVSPVTSPEPRYKQHPRIEIPPRMDVPENVVLNPDVTAGSPDSKNVKHTGGEIGYYSGEKSFQPIGSKNARDPMLESREGVDAAFDVKHRADMTSEVVPPPEDSSMMAQYGNMELAKISTTEFVKHRNEIAMVTAKTAGKILDAEDRNEGSDWDNNLMHGSSVGQSNTIVPPSVEGDLTSSTASSAGVRRKRSKRLQFIMEQAAVAFIELRRREQNSLPPKQRKEAAEKRAEEEARLKSERDSLNLIDTAIADGNFSVILQQMKYFPKSHAVVKAGVSAVEVYCRNENLYFDLCEEGGVEELVSGATLHGTNDESLAVSFCNAILALSQHFNDKVGHMVRGVGAPSLVIELLEHHKTSVEVQRAGCECLAVIAGSSELSRSAVATLGGPSAVYRAMTKNNSSFKDVQLAKSALKAVRYIAQDNERAAEYLVQVAALDTVSRAAEVFTDHGLEMDILSALRAFSFYDGGRRNVIMSSGLRALTMIMLRNREPEFLVQCCTFIRAIARWRDHECEEAMLQSSISERIVSLMQLSNDIPGEHGAKVAWYSSHACTFLASFGSRSRQRLRMVGAIQTAIIIMRTRKENARVVHSATDALAELLKGEPESKMDAEQFDVVGALNDAMALHRNVTRVRNALQWTLDFLKAPATHNTGSVNTSRICEELMQKQRLTPKPGQMLTEEAKHRPLGGFKNWFPWKR